MWQSYLQPSTLAEALHSLHQHAGQARIVAGGTDVLVELQRGVKPTATLIDISKIPGLKYVRAADGLLRLGALATHNDVLASPECRQGALPLAQACWEVGAPQIRTRATIAGNLVTASPANDTITPLIALDAELLLQSAAGERAIALAEFYTGFRRTALQPDEILREIRFRPLAANQRGLFLKLGLRRAQAISVLNVALVVTLDGDTVTAARIALGCVAPTIIRAFAAETFLAGKALTAEHCTHAAQLAAAAATPIDDLRGSATYRLRALTGMIADGLLMIAAGREREGFPEQPVLLETENLEPGTQNLTETQAVSGQRSAVSSQEPPIPDPRPPTPDPRPPVPAIHTVINGRAAELTGAHTTTLLNALRDQAGLTGTKEGCAEGECGACTVWLDGQAVMACLVPAAQAHGATLRTIEGLGDGALHPLQQAFIDHGAVQCGFCIPGMLMAGAKLLQERPGPDREAAQVAISGNICRCTGYRKILDAVLAAGGE